MAISGTKVQGWRAIPTQNRKAVALVVYWYKISNINKSISPFTVLSVPFTTISVVL